MSGIPYRLIIEGEVPSEKKTDLFTQAGAVQHAIGQVASVETVTLIISKDGNELAHAGLHVVIPPESPEADADATG